ncbi:MAG: GerMN domain-containing protein [Lachnospiraceae bacterium]|nr:GerMN domain-containing protein [Lachnospiraceae bacterium]
MKKYIRVLLLLCVVFLTACGGQEKPNEEEKALKSNQIYVYLADLDRTGLVSRVYTLDQENTLTQNVDSLVQYMAEVVSDEESQSPVPEGITYLENHLEQRRGRLEVSFEVAYDKVDADSMLFFKACITKTLLQLEGVDSISLSLTDVASTNEETATVVEYLDSDSFVLSFGKNSGYKQSGTIILYFANETGESLKEYRKVIEISNNTSLARIVVESLIEGPEEDGYQATLSDATTIRNISVKDGICYVDLSDEFYNADNPLKNDVIVYSVVNSLVELPTISKVQFLKNGEKQPFFRETMEFDGIFERNLDLIEQEETEE